MRTGDNLTHFPLGDVILQTQQPYKLGVQEFTESFKTLAMFLLYSLDNLSL